MWRRIWRSMEKCTAMQRSPNKCLTAFFLAQTSPRTSIYSSCPIWTRPTSYNLLRVAASGGVTVGPILLGAGKPVHILTQSATVRSILNMTALAAVDATQINARATTKPAA